MKYYVAARYKNQKEAMRIAEKLEAVGDEVLSSWLTEGFELKRPYRESRNKEEEKHVKKALQEADEADAFILISEPGMRGTYIELGAYLSARVNNNEPVLFHLIGLNEQEHVFKSFEGTKFYDSVEDFLKELDA